MPPSVSTIVVSLNLHPDAMPRFPFGLAATLVATASALKTPSPILKAASAVVTPLLKPIYSLEAPLQATVTGIFNRPKVEDVRAEIDATLKSPCVVYSYPVSPFCTEAVSVLESTGCKVTVVEPGLEWFLLGPKGSALRAELGRMTGQTSFPQIFIGGEFVGGLFSGGASGGGLAKLAESGELIEKLKKARAL
jgi:glutaredoxin-related protein